MHLQTEYEGQVKKYMEVLENTDAIIAAGGDGTLLEVSNKLISQFIFSENYSDVRNNKLSPKDVFQKSSLKKILV